MFYIIFFRTGFQLRMKSVTGGRCNNNVWFIYNLCNGLMNSSDSLGEISLVIPSFNLKNPSAFKSNFHSHISIDRVLLVINNVNNIDMFHNT